MLKGVTNTFIANCNARELTYSEYIIIDGQQVPIRAKLSDDCYDFGNFVGSFIFKEIEFETSNDISYRNKEFEYYKVVNGESIKIGTFITTEIENNDTTEIVRVVGMDYGLKTQVEYVSNLDYGSGTVTLKDVWDEACLLSGLESGIQTFPNDDFIVDSDQFTGTGATIRDVFIGIALSSGTFVKVMNDDKIYLIFNEETDEIIEDYTELQDKRDTHPITCVRLGLTNIDGENVDYIDEELVEEYGENWLIINDNPFAYNQSKREELIMAIFNNVKEFGYSAFVTKTSFKPYLTCGDLIRFRNKNGDLVNSILLRYTHEYKEDDMEITLEAPSETSATVKYVYPLQAIDIAKKTQVEVDKEKVQVQIISERVTNVQSDLAQNYYTKDQANILVQNAETGVTNTFSEAGGNNIFRNTGLWFENEDDDTRATSPYEFWTGKVVKLSEERSANFNALLLQDDTLTQRQTVPNGNYAVSFKYKKLIELADVKVVINGTEYPLTSMSETMFYTGQQDIDGSYIIPPLEVNSQEIKIDFISDTDNACEVYDLMVNAGKVKLAYSQNQNETTTDTVNISKGITITSTDVPTTFKANADGIRVYANSDLNNAKTYFTDKGMTTDEIVVENKAEVVGLLFQKIGNQIWISKL